MKVNHYKMNFISSEFLLHFIENENDTVYLNFIKLVQNNLSFIVLRSLEFLKLTANDLCCIESGENVMKKEEEKVSDEEEQEELEENDGYNVNWTLRKCSSKLIDKMSHIFKKEILNIIKSPLEEGIQSKNWLVKYLFN